MIRRAERIGRVRDRLSEMLAEHDILIAPDDLRTNRYYQTKYFDGCSWTGDGRRADGSSVHVWSWDTMTELVRYGFELDNDPYRDLPNQWELHVKETPE